MEPDLSLFDDYEYDQCDCYNKLDAKPATIHSENELVILWHSEEKIGIKSHQRVKSTFIK